MQSAMASLLTTTPAFYIFGMSDRYWDRLTEDHSLDVVNKYKPIIGIDRILRAILIFIYVATVLNFDPQYVEGVPYVGFLGEISAEFVSDMSASVQKSSLYLQFGFLVFFGSVLATVVSFFPIRGG